MSEPSRCPAIEGMTLTEKQRAHLHFKLFRSMFPAFKITRCRWSHIFTPDKTYPSRRDAERGAYSRAQTAIRHDDNGVVVGVDDN